MWAIDDDLHHLNHSQAAGRDVVKIMKYKQFSGRPMGRWADTCLSLSACGSHMISPCPGTAGPHAGAADKAGEFFFYTSGSFCAEPQHIL
jgi:hypothetical protein